MNQEPIFTLNEELGIEVTAVPQQFKDGKKQSCWSHGIQCSLHPTDCKDSSGFLCRPDTPAERVIFFTRENYFRWAAARLTNLNSKIET